MGAPGDAGGFHGLDGRSALVTGASSGIGSEVARQLADAGVTVHASGRREPRLRALGEGLSPCARERIIPIAGDIDDEQFRHRLAAQAEGVDILVNAAGCLMHAPFLEADPRDWEGMWHTNVHAVLCLTQLVARGMARRQRGHIINISSILASRVYPLTLGYAATKHAVRAISQGLRLELHEHGIKVTEVAPGQVRTEIFRGEQHPRVSEAYQSRPFQPIDPQDIAAAILGALRMPLHASVDLIEVNPVGQS
ncbi:SDR family oxidoreductase [Castellaniella sp. GW247-6E4]|uniref:SDR family oxidoreductase n=1 Tax=Castellaniella sp. GW247-6E4 TaxID=3140380 RepID=UPI003314F42C